MRCTCVRYPPVCLTLFFISRSKYPSPLSERWIEATSPASPRSSNRSPASTPSPEYSHALHSIIVWPHTVCLGLSFSFLPPSRQHFRRVFRLHLSLFWGQTVNNQLHVESLAVLLAIRQISTQLSLGPIISRNYRLCSISRRRRRAEGAPREKT